MNYRLKKQNKFQMRGLVLIFMSLIIACDSQTDEVQPMTAFEFNEIDIVQVQADYKSGKYSIQDLVQAYLDRIETIDLIIQNSLTLNEYPPLPLRGFDAFIGVAGWKSKDALAKYVQVLEPREKANE